VNSLALWTPTYTTIELVIPPVSFLSSEEMKVIILSATGHAAATI